MKASTLVKIGFSVSQISIQSSTIPSAQQAIGKNKHWLSKATY